MSRQPGKSAAGSHTPAFERPLVVGRPRLPDSSSLLPLIGEVLASGRLSNGGPRVVELERRVAALHEVRHCIATCNGTLALELMLRAAQLTGDVVVPSFTFIATAHAVTRSGLTPVFADVDPLTHNLDPRSVERVITERTSAILGVHLWGRPCDVEGLAAVAERHDLQLLFDAAHGFGCSYQGRSVGGLGRAEAFSFHATKFFHTIEGGAVMTDDDDLAENVRLQRNFGFADSLESVIVGGNAKLNEVCAAIGLSQLDSLDELAETNRRRHMVYRRELEGVSGLRLVEYPDGERSNYHYVPLEVDAAAAGLTRNDLLGVLLAENVLARPYFSHPCHRAAAYGNMPTPVLPITERLARRTLALPTGPDVSLDDVRTVCDLIRSAIAGERRPSAPDDRTRSPARQSLARVGALDDARQPPVRGWSRCSTARLWALRIWLHVELFCAEGRVSNRRFHRSYDDGCGRPLVSLSRNISRRPGLGIRFRVESRLRGLALRIDRASSRELAVKLTLKKVAGALTEAGVPFLLAGGASRWARGGPPMTHDLDFVVTPQDAARAQEVLRQAGLRSTPIPEAWCLRAWNGDVAVDLISEPIGLTIMDDFIRNGDEVELLGVTLRLMRLEDDLVTKLMSINEHSLHVYEGALRAARALREQADWDAVRSRTAHSPFARAFFVIAEGLDIVPAALTMRQGSANGTGLAAAGGTIA